MPQPPLLSPSRFGFMPLDRADLENSASGSNGNNHHDNYEIPLTNISTNRSATTGSRQANQTAPNMEDLGGSDEKLDSGKTGLFHRKVTSKPAGRRRVRRTLSERGRAETGDGTQLNALGRIYNAVIGFSAITRYFVYIIPVGALLAVPLIVLPITGHHDDILLGGWTDTTVKPPDVHPGYPLFNLFLWIEISWFSLWIGKSVARLLPPAFMFVCGVVSSGVRKYATVLRALEIPFSLFFWSLASWLVFKFMFGDDAVAWVNVIKKILGAAFVSSAVYLVEKAFVQLISIGYHQRSFSNRISDSKHEVHLLGIMYEASRTLFPMYCPEFLDEDYLISDSLDAKFGHKRGMLSGSVTPMNHLVAGAGRFGDKVTSVFGNLASEVTGKQVFNPNSAHSIVIEALEKTRSSEALGRRLWMSFVTEGSDALKQEDILEVLGPAHQEEAQECFETIDADRNGDISLDEMVRKVIEVSKERKAIANSMKDIGQALAVFDSVLMFLVLLIVIFIFLSFFQSSFITTLATAGTALLSLSFVFAATTQEFLGAVIFLFVKHPYDVGDRVDITSVALTVERISLLFTVFTRIDKMEQVQIPHTVLTGLWIENVTRSKAMKELVEVDVSYDTTFEDVELLRVELENFVRHPDNSRDYMPDIAIGIGGVGNLDKLSLKIAIKHKSNWHNESVRATRRSKFICALALAMKKVPVYPPGGGYDPLGGAANPSYSVAVSNDFAIAARDTSAKNKDKGRMVPKNPTTAAEGEKDAVADLTAIPPTDGADMMGYNRDDGTGNERSDSTERRNQSIEQMRTDLKKVESSRGRRKAGEGVPSAAFGQQRAATGSTSSAHGFRQRTMTAGVERQPSGAGYGVGHSTSAPGALTSQPPMPYQSQLPPIQQGQATGQPAQGYSPRT